jgi:Tol biopolymer transport system component
MVMKISRRFCASAIAITAVLGMASGVAAAEDVRAQLARAQQQTGLTIEWYYSGINTAHFKDRSVTTDKVTLQAHDFENALISPDGSMFAFPAPGPDNGRKQPLTIVRRDGTTVNQYPALVDPTVSCWSHDGSKLVVRSRLADSRPPVYQLFALNLGSNSIQQFGEPGSYATSQCWSPDNQQIVYGTNDRIRIYNFATASSRTVAQGDFPNWSPDGEEIAFHKSDGYYALSPTGAAARRLFKTKQGRSELFWSPDSKIVAYLGAGGTFRETLRYLDVGLIQVRVVRLSDGSEDWLWQTPDVPPAWSLNCVWLISNDKMTLGSPLRKR